MAGERLARARGRARAHAAAFVYVLEPLDVALEVSELVRTVARVWLPHPVELDDELVAGVPGV